LFLEFQGVPNHQQQQQQQQQQHSVCGVLQLHGSCAGWPFFFYAAVAAAAARWYRPDCMLDWPVGGSEAMVNALVR
jgi:hypothetical protein